MQIAQVPSSFRDPCGFVVRHDGLYKRVVTASGRNDYETLMKSGLYDELVKEEFLIPHEEEESNQAAYSDVYKILFPEQLEYVSYPYEWCFSQLRDAALLTLEVQARALGHGMSLKDASAFNIQFRNGKPVFIDTLSFEKDEGGPWIAYEQFCRHFVAPLLLMARRGLRFNQYLRVELDGFPLDLTSRLLGWRTYFRPGSLLHIHLHSRAQQSKGRRLLEGESAHRGPGIKRLLTESLRKTVANIKLRCDRTEWSDYEQSADHYPPEAVAFKKAFVGTVVECERPRLVYDCGGNTGAYSRVASAHGSRCVLFDSDPLCVEMAYRAERSRGDGRILPLVMDLRNPTPALGFDISERLSLLERPPADLVLALAVVHHLRIGGNIPFEQLAGFFRKLGRLLVVEFVPPGDPLAEAMMRTRKLAAEEYGLDRFLRAFRAHFRIRQSAPIPGTTRCLLLLEGTA